MRQLARLDSGNDSCYGGWTHSPLWQLGLVESARLRLRDDTWVQGSVRLRVADNYDKFRYTGPSSLPRVRTFLREHLPIDEGVNRVGQVARIEEAERGDAVHRQGAHFEFKPLVVRIGVDNKARTAGRRRGLPLGGQPRALPVERELPEDLPGQPHRDDPQAARQHRTTYA